MNFYLPVGLFIVTAIFHGLLAVGAFLRMRIRPIRDASGRVRFRPMASDKPATPELVELDPRADGEIAAKAAE